MKTQACLLVLIGMMIASQSRAENLKNTVEVHATGTVSVPADSVVLRVLVESKSSELQEVKKRNDELTAPVYQLAEAQHVARPILLATNLSFDFVPPQSGRLQPQQGVPQGKANQQQDDNAQGNQQFQRCSGDKNQWEDRSETPQPPIRMSRDLEVKFHDFNQAIGFLAEAVKWNSVRTTCEVKLAPLSFDVAEREKYVIEARGRAVAAAREKAKFLAEHNALKLGDATMIFDETSDFEGHPGGAPGIPGMLMPTPSMPGGGDPFSTMLPSRSHGGRPVIRFAAMEKGSEKTDIDHVAPAHLAITASVRIVFDVGP